MLKNKKVSFGKFIMERVIVFLDLRTCLCIRKFQIDINCLKFGIAAESK